MNDRHQTPLAENTPGAPNPNLAAARSRQLNCAEDRQGKLAGGDVVMWRVNGVFDCLLVAGCLGSERTYRTLTGATESTEILWL